ncbi:MAG: prenyltransferase [Streptosporangiaceae bacterium]
MRGHERPDGWVPEVAGVLTADQLLETGRAIVAVQQEDGAIGWPDMHVDAWNHVECAMALSACGLRGPARRAYGWLTATQRRDGSWPVRTADGTMADRGAESNHAVYPAVGVWHEFLVTGDEAFVSRMWPLVRAGVEFALGLQRPGGEIIWRRLADGSADGYALLAGCASMYQGLRCAIALADHLGIAQPDWELAAAQLSHAVACHPAAFADKSRYSMDWYYPVLGGPLRGPAAHERLAAGWDTFVVPGLGIRCVSDEPWVTGAETCELALALDAIGDQARALELLEQIQHLRAPGGAYWTGWQFVTQAHFPNEQSAWTAATVILAADALSGASGGAAIFADVALGPEPMSLPAADPGSGRTAACGCASADPVSGPL